VVEGGTDALAVAGDLHGVAMAFGLGVAAATPAQSYPVQRCAMHGRLFFQVRIVNPAGNFGGSFAARLSIYPQ